MTIRADAAGKRLVSMAEMSTVYQDRWIRCEADGIRIRAYYFPWGTKRIPYSVISGFQRVRLSWGLRGKGRIWGTANPRSWASLDPGRPDRETGFVLDLGGRIRPFVTPDDPDAFEAAVREHTNLTPGNRELPAPVI